MCVMKYTVLVLTKDSSPGVCWLGCSAVGAFSASVSVSDFCLT